MSAIRTFYEKLIAMDEALHRGGVPPFTPWWRAELRRFYDHPTARLHGGRVGRGGIKSKSSAECLTAETILQTWIVPPGERHWAINISENLDEAKARLEQIATYLTILGVPHERTSEQIILTDRPLGFWSRPARIGALSGPRVVAWSVDEAAKLSVDGVNPAEELVISLKAASISHPNARGRIYSSAWSTLDYHYTVIEAGDTPSTVVSIAPTWVANPSITEQRTHELESSPKAWAREYACIPSASVSAAFDADAVDRSFAPRRVSDTVVEGERFMVLDPSGVKSGGDTFAWGIAAWYREGADAGCMQRSDGSPMRYRSGAPIMRDGWKPTPPFIRFIEVGGFDGGMWTTTARDVVSKLSCVGTKHNVRKVFSDQREEWALSELFRTAGLKFTALTWTNTSKSTGVELVRRWFADRTLWLPQHETLRRQLHAFSEKYLPSGLIGYGARTGHDDFAALLLTTALAELNNLLPSGQGKSRGPEPGMVDMRITPF